MTWALISNGVRARILRQLENSDAGAAIELISRSRSTHLRESLSDRPGRNHALGPGARRSVMEPGSDPIRRDMQDFALQTLGLLEQHLRARDFNRLAIFASPRMLGILREEMPTALLPAVILERNFNLIQMPGPELRRVVCLLLQSVPKTMPNARS